LLLDASGLPSGQALCRRWSFNAKKLRAKQKTEVMKHDSDVQWRETVEQAIDTLLGRQPVNEPPPTDLDF